MRTWWKWLRRPLLLGGVAGLVGLGLSLALQSAGMG
jgi:hypothetical protein